MGPIRVLTFWNRALDPGTRLAEILFGLVMTLTFTLGAGLLVQQEGREGARTLLIAMIGCNAAWGVSTACLIRRNRVVSQRTTGPIARAPLCVSFI